MCNRSELLLEDDLEEESPPLLEEDGGARGVPVEDEEPVDEEPVEEELLPLESAILFFTEGF